MSKRSTMRLVRPATLTRWLAVACASLACLVTACDEEGTYPVSSTADSGDTSLRAAIANANGSTSSEVRIELASGTYVLDRCGADDTNLQGDLDLVTTAKVTLIGTGPNVVIRQTCPGERVLDHHGAGLLTLQNVTITGGSVVGTASEEEARGGGVRAAGDVRLERATLKSNAVAGAPGAESGATATDGGAAHGGGLYAGGSLTAIDAVFSENTATGGAGLVATTTDGVATAGGAAAGGGAYAVGAITSSGGSVTKNAATGGNCTAKKSAGHATGGGLVTEASLSATNVNVAENIARGGTNSLLDDPGAGAPAGEARGGGLAALATARVTGGSFSANRVISGDAKFMCIPRSVPSPIPYEHCGGTAPSAALGGAVWAADLVNVKDGSYQNNRATMGAGAVAYAGPLCQSYPQFCGRSAEFPPKAAGGAVQSGASLTIEGGAYTGNSADGGSHQIAAAVHAATDVTITRARFEANKAVDGGAPAIAASGKVTIRHTPVLASQTGVSAATIEGEGLTIAHSAWASIYATGTVSLSNSTITNNGGGISADRLELIHTTVTSNATSSAIQVKSLTSHFSLVDETGVICASTVVVEAASYSWFSDASCGVSGVGVQQGPGDFLLGPLAANGGAVPTRKPAPASVLVDAIPIAACSTPVDARGVSRPQATGCDIGAVEVNRFAGVGAADIALTFPGAPSAITPGRPTALQVLVTNRGPASVEPAVFIEVPENFVLSSLTGPTGASCTIGAPSVCIWSSPIVAGGSATLSLVVNSTIDVSIAAEFRARAIGQQLVAPFEDDSVVLSLPVTASSGVSLVITNNRYGRASCRYPCADPFIRVHNQGPFDAIGTAQSPIRVWFEPAAGITTQPGFVLPASTGALSGTGSMTEFVGIIPAGESIDMLSFAILDPGVRPDVLGTVHLDPGQNALFGPAAVTAYRSNLELRAERTPGVQASGAPASFVFELTSHSAGPEQNVLVSLYADGSAFNDRVTFEPETGVVAPGEYGAVNWQIPSIAPGQTVRLRGSALYEFSAERAPDSPSPRVGAWSIVRPFQFYDEDLPADVDMSVAPEGTADLRVTSVTVLPGSGPQQRIVRGVVENLGASAARSPAEGARIRVVPSATFYDSWQGLNLANIKGTTSSSGWTCTWDGCAATEPIAAGRSASFEFVVDGLFADPRDLLGLHVEPAAYPLSIIPDPNLGNNRLLVPVPFLKDQ